MNPVYGPLHGTSTWSTIENPGDKQRPWARSKATSWIYSYNKNKIIK